MRAKRVGRPGKIDRDTMKMTNIGLIIIVIILLILLSVSAITIFNPEVLGYIKACLRNLFN